MSGDRADRLIGSGAAPFVAHLHPETRMSPIEQDARRRWLPVLAGGLIMGAALGIRHVQGLFLAPVTLDHGWSREAFGL
ncbi:major facilitator superfamily MFS_1, partial [Burkholderia multivorans CGD1]